MKSLGFFSNLKQKILAKFQSWREVGEYNATFTSFGSNAYKSEIVRSCIRPLADFTGKASAKCSDKNIEKILNNRPNMYMNGKEFLSKIRTQYELKNNAFIYIQRNDKGKPTAFMPITYDWIEALEYANGLFVKFHFSNGESIVLPWADLAVLRKDYNESNIVGDDNRAIINTLDMLSTCEQGMANAIRATANLRGILKSTKSMLSPDDVKAAKDAFVKEYLSLENEGGIASLDATQEFTPISMSPIITSFEQMKEFRENVYRYFGVNDDIVMSKMKTEQLEVFYESRIEPFLVDLSLELSTKVFSTHAQSFDNWIVYEANKLQFTSLDKKINMFSTVVLYGGMTVNEWREACNMSPIEGGDEIIRRLDAAPVDDPNGGNKDNSEENEDGKTD